MFAVLAVIGCGGTGSAPAVRAGGASFDVSTVAHWTRAVGLEGGIATSLARPAGTAREKALDLLIAANWLIGEASARRLAVSNSTVERRLRERIDSQPNGRSEFEQEISSMGRTIADVELELRAEAAAERLRGMVSSWTPPVARADVADYYRLHRAQYRVPALRLTDLIEGFHSRAAATMLAKRLGAGEAFAKRAVHEHVAAEPPAEATRRNNRQLVEAIFAARPGTIAGPARFHHVWAVAVVRKVIPAATKPLAAVAEGIAAQLVSERRRQTMTAFLEGFQRRWSARTDCKAGYVVQKCSQYRGPVTPESNPLIGP
ncbi:MAG TPA: peptidylprolyl isomerase [Solirubrobacteraceae bacterium]|nr:peptidylprolyl isomerase [Solirubrobacteraceae bacterium]